MVITKELQEQLLACKESCVARCREVFLKPQLEGDFLFLLTDVGNDIFRVEPEYEKLGQYRVCGYLSKGARVFYPESGKVSLEQGPLKQGLSLNKLRFQKSREAYQDLIQIVFHEDGTPNEDEIPDGMCTTSNLDSMEALVMLSAGIISHDQGGSFTQFLEAINNCGRPWLPKTEVLLSLLDLNMDLIVKAEALEGRERDGFFSLLRKELYDISDHRLIKNLYTISFAKQRAENILHRYTSHRREFVLLNKNMDKNPANDHKIRLVAYKNGAKFEESYYADDVPFCFSPLGILGNQSHVEEIPNIYCWDEIYSIKRGNAVLYKK